MKRLFVYLEINGCQEYVGSIEGNSYRDARFSYAKKYIEEVPAKHALPISVSMPLQEEAFSAFHTRNFFEGLLPEGFFRKSLADYLKTDEYDYVTILAALGNECLGAIRITEEGGKKIKSGYERLSLDQVRELASDGTTKSSQLLMETHLSLTGASGKVGLYYNGADGNWYLPKGDAPSTHIVKQSHVRLSRIVLNEQLCMNTAKEIGIDVPECFIVNTGDGDDSDILYATGRYDREQGDTIISGLHVPRRLHQEDFSQALNIPASEKYEKENRGYMEKMMSLVRQSCADPIKEQIKLWKMICFNFLIGNTDSHIKNYSLLYSSNLKGITLAPAYDIVSTRVYDMTGEMSYFIGGELNIEKIKRKNFELAAGQIGLPEKLAMSIFDETASCFEKALVRSSEILFEEGFNDVKSIKNKILSRGGYANL